MKVCPKCKSKDITVTIYGLICKPDKKLEKALNDGKVRLGGCCIDENSKQFWCNNCTFEWGRL